MQFRVSGVSQCGTCGRSQKENDKITSDNRASAEAVFRTIHRLCPNCLITSVRSAVQFPAIVVAQSRTEGDTLPRAS
jgi:hypothetical protein